MCNNLFDCINKKSTEKDTSFDYSDYENEEDDDILTTQNPESYNNYNFRDYGWELATDGVCPKFCMQCKSKKRKTLQVRGAKPCKFSAKPCKL